MNRPNTLSSVSCKQRKSQSIWQSANCSIFVAIVNESNKTSPAWAAIGDPYSPDYCCKITLFFNSAFWPIAGALERRDFRVLRWLGACAVLDRLVVSRDPLPRAVYLDLATLALKRIPEAFERGNSWAGYKLMDHELFLKLETLPIFDDPTGGRGTILGSFNYKFRSDILQEWLQKYAPSGRKWRAGK